MPVSKKRNKPSKVDPYSRIAADLTPTPWWKLRITPQPRPQATKRLGRAVALRAGTLIASIFVTHLYIGHSSPPLAGLMFIGYLVGGYMLVMGLLTIIYRPYTALAGQIPILGYILAVIGGGFALGGVKSAFEYSGHLRAGIGALAAICLAGAIALFRDSRRIARAMDEAEWGSSDA